MTKQSGCLRLTAWGLLSVVPDRTAFDNNPELFESDVLAVTEQELQSLEQRVHEDASRAEAADQLHEPVAAGFANGDPRAVKALERSNTAAPLLGPDELRDFLLTVDRLRIRWQRLTEHTDEALAVAVDRLVSAACALLTELEGRGRP